MTERRVKLSKLLSRILRHGAEREGIAMDAGGFVHIDTLLAHHLFRGVKRDEIADIVRSCSKQRFAIAIIDGGECIRANQGHTISTIQADMLLQPLGMEDAADYPTVIHGTFRHALPSILASGLSRMRRQHIHFATQGFSSAAGISGLRGNAEIVIAIDLHAALAEGIPFYVSANSVVLSPGVGDTGILPPRFITHVYEVLPDHRLRELPR